MLGREVRSRLAQLRLCLGTWDELQRRSFPWRDVDNAYLRLVAEVLLQRTRADAVNGLWNAFVREFGSPERLAGASEDHLAGLIAPLGLAAKRARYLKMLGQEIVALGGVPLEAKVLSGLSGIGPYSSAAFLTSWLGIATAPVDINVRRVLGRSILGVHVAGRGETRELVGQLLEQGEPRAVLFALLDLGSYPCRPRGPRCGECPARSACLFAQQIAAGQPDPRPMAVDSPSNATQLPTCDRQPDLDERSIRYRNREPDRYGHLPASSRRSRSRRPRRSDGRPGG